MTKKWRGLQKIYSIIKDFKQEEEFAQYTLERLWKKWEDDKTIFYLTKNFLRFSMMSFVSIEIHRNIPQGASARLKKRDKWIVSWEDEIDSIVQEATTINESSNSWRYGRTGMPPFEKVWLVQIYDRIAETYGAVWIGYLQEAFTTADMMRITGLKMSEIRETKRQLVEEIQEWHQGREGHGN
jgi:hypothetical protein|tara:strand:+ start:6990 stop:7538 length:549 start_codon:yes stop_codon:yes gene_type:complete